jgi:predicted RNA binding protein YcfA (HicA-like mRNA interferase family)
VSHHHSDVLKPKEVVRILEDLGFQHVRSHGSHQHYRDQGGRHTIVPFHQGSDVEPGLARRIAKEIGIPFEEFLSHR